jgi:hypothetical protein
MRKCSLTLCLLILTVMVNGTASAEQSKPAAPDAAAAAPAESETKAKFHEAEAEVVSVDGEKKTVTLKTAAGESTAPVDEKAQANLADLKPGQKVTVVCRDDEKGEHKAVAEIKTTPPAEKPAQ